MSKRNSNFESENAVEALFLSKAPRIATFPHTLIECGERALRAVAAATHSSLGLWGEAPLFRSDDKPYVEPNDGRVEEDFRLWKLNSNQQHLFGRAKVAPDPSFRMFISSETPVSVLSKTYEHFDTDSGSPWFGDYIQYVCDWLPSLRWALIPLEGELLWCLFVTAPGSELLVESVENESRKAGLSLSRVEIRGTDYRLSST